MLLKSIFISVFLLSTAAMAATPLIVSPNAKVSMLMAIDYQCPYSKQVIDYLPQLQAKYGAQLEVSVSHNPLTFHPQGMPAAVAAECAYLQGKFTEFTFAAYANQAALGNDFYIQTAQSVGVPDMPSFQNCMANQISKVFIDSDLVANKALGVTGTPFIFINGKLLKGAYPYASYTQAIDAALKANPAFKNK